MNEQRIAEKVASSVLRVAARKDPFRTEWEALVEDGSYLRCKLVKTSESKQSWGIGSGGRTHGPGYDAYVDGKHLMTVSPKWKSEVSRRIKVIGEESFGGERRVSGLNSAIDVRAWIVAAAIMRGLVPAMDTPSNQNLLKESGQLT